MRIPYVFLAVFSLLASTGAAFAKPDIGKAVFHYGGITGAWYLNAKCKFLKAAASSELEWHAAMIYVALRKSGQSHALLSRIQNTARKSASEPPYSGCGPAGRKLAAQGLRLGRTVTRALTGKSFNNDQLAAFRLVRLARVVLGINTANKCKFWDRPENRALRPRVRLVFDTVNSRLLRLYGSAKVNLAFDAGNRLRRRVSCDRTGYRMFVGSLSLLRRLQADLGIPKRP